MLNSALNVRVTDFEQVPETLAIVLVDDEDFERKRMERQIRQVTDLMSMEVQVHSSSGLADFQSTLSRVKPDLCLIDWNLGGADDGAAALCMVRQAAHARNSYSVVISGLADECLVTRAFKAGASAFYEKSELTPERLREVLILAHAGAVYTGSAKSAPVPGGGPLSDKGSAIRHWAQMATLRTSMNERSEDSASGHTKLLHSNEALIGDFPQFSGPLDAFLKDFAQVDHFEFVTLSTLNSDQVQDI